MEFCQQEVLEKGQEIQHPSPYLDCEWWQSHQKISSWRHCQGVYNRQAWLCDKKVERVERKIDNYYC